MSKIQITTNNDSAIITHYLQNANTKYALPFEKDALYLLNSQYEDKEIGVVKEPEIQYNLFPELFSVPFPAPKNPKFTFIDLFAGIGGFRIGRGRPGAALRSGTNCSNPSASKIPCRAKAAS